MPSSFCSETLIGETVDGQTIQVRITVESPGTSDNSTLDNYGARGQNAAAYLANVLVEAPGFDYGIRRLTRSH